MTMICFHNCFGTFRAAVRHAKEVGAFDSLKDCLRRLHNPHGPQEFQFRNDLHLYKDFAPASFEFCLHRRGGGLIYNGGLIFYEGAESGVTGQLSVTTSGLKHARYEIHT
jgi:hypothetical protein